MSLNLKMLGTNIQSKRKAMHLNQEELAFRVGISRNYMSMIENGKKEVSITFLVEIAENLGCTVNDFLIPFYKNQHFGAVMLYGHVHNTKEWEFIEKWKHELWNEEIPCNMINVGAMITYMNYTPRTLEELLEANPTPEFRHNLRKLSEELK